MRKYFEIVSFQHENSIFNTYAEAFNALNFGKYKDEFSAFIVTRYY
jgi:hypothetical protein